MASRLGVDHYVVDTLMRDLVGHDKTPSAFVVYLYLWKRTFGERRKSVAASHATIASDTGLSRSAVQASVRLLLKRRLLRSSRSSVTAVPDYTVLRPWIR